MIVTYLVYARNKDNRTALFPNDRGLEMYLPVAAGRLSTRALSFKVHQASKAHQACKSAAGRLVRCHVTQLSKTIF